MQQHTFENAYSGQVLPVSIRFLLILLFASFVFPLSTTFFGIRVYPLDLVLLPLILVSLLFIPQLDSIQISKIDILFFLFILWTILTTLASQFLKPQLNLEGLFLLARGVFLFFIIRYTYNIIFDKSDLKKVATLLLLFEGGLATFQALLQSNIGALNQYFGSETNIIFYETINGFQILQSQGTFGNPNILAGWLLFLLPIVVAAHIDGINPHPRVQYTAIFFGTIGIITSLSFGAILVFIGGILVFLVLNMKRELVYSRVMWIVTLGAVSTGSILPTIFSTSTLPWTKRVKMINAAWELILQAPIFGVGYDQFVPSVNNYDLYFRSSKSGVHNLFLLLSSEMGILAGLLFFGALFQLITLVLSTNSGRLENLCYVWAIINMLALSQFHLSHVSFQFLPLIMVFLGCFTAIGLDQISQSIDYE